MKAILVIDIPHCCHDCICADWDQCLCKASNREIYSHEYMDGGRQAWCPLKHPLKYASNDFYIYDTKYLMENLDREIELLKGVKEYESHSCD